MLEIIEDNYVMKKITFMKMCNSEGLPCALSYTLKIPKEPEGEADKSTSVRDFNLPFSVTDKSIT